jgi:hypothetical protein
MLGRAFLLHFFHKNRLSRLTFRNVTMNRVFSSGILLTFCMHPTSAVSTILRREKLVRKIGLRKICAISFIIIIFSAIASAQLPSGGNAFFGYSYLSGETFANSTTTFATGGSASMNGWETSAEGKYLPWLGVVADLDWHYGGRSTTCVIGTCPRFRLNASRDTLLFGPRASMKYGRYRPFAEFLFGVGYQSDKGGGISNSDISFAIAFGGGVDYHLVRSVSLRGQFDIVHTSFFGGGQNDPRISTGIVFQF